MFDLIFDLDSKILIVLVCKSQGISTKNKQRSIGFHIIWTVLAYLTVFTFPNKVSC